LKWKAPRTGGRVKSEAARCHRIVFVRLTNHQSLPVRSCMIDGEAIVVNVSF
jgi:hypothetical protein